MAEMVVLSSLGQLEQFKNEKGFIEIVTRGKNKKYNTFKNVVIENLGKGQGQESELLGKVLSKLDKNADLSKKNFDMLKNVSKLSQLNVLLSGLNLCATCAGFAIMYSKLDQMSGQINQVMGLIKKGNDVQADYEFKKVISEHANMLDSRKTKKYYTEEQMRKLVDDEYNVLNMLIDVYRKDLSEDNESLIFSIYSLASMLAVSIRYFDELYYTNNKEAIGDGDVWHSSHDNWMSVFDKLSSDEFVKKLQDHGVLELNLSTVEADQYYTSLFSQVKELAEDIEDNQTLIQMLDSEELLAEYKECIDKEVSKEIREAFEQTEGVMENEEVVNALQDTMKQMALSF